MGNGILYFFKALFMGDWVFFGKGEWNITLWTIVFWIVFLVISFLLASWILGDNLEDLEKDTGEKPNTDVRFKSIIIAIVFTCICAFFWFNVFN